jgi:PAS domain S-box-containing protein
MFYRPLPIFKNRSIGIVELFRMVQETTRILLIEDDSVYAERMLHAFAIGDGAFQTSVVASLAAARALCETQLPDLIITEWALRDGCALDLLLGSVALPSLPLIVLSHTNSCRSAVAAIKAGALEYLVKSEIAPVDLPLIVRRAISEHTPLAEQAEGIYKRTQAEQAIHESEQWFRTLICDLHVGVMLQGPHAEILHCNQAALDLLGLSEDQLLGKTSLDPSWNVIREDGSLFPGPTHPVPEAIAMRGPVRDVVMGVYRPRSGDRIWLLVNAEPQLAPNGEVRQVTCSFSDITARRQAELAVRDLNNALEQRVAELARAARLKDEFLASMSHELRTPLNTILGMAESLLERIYGALTDEQTEALQSVESSGQHLLALINDILDLSKIEAGRLVLNTGPIAIEEIIQSSLRMINQPAQQKRLTVSLERDSAVDVIVADPRRLKQMLVNLLSNAVKFTPDGGAIGVEIAGDAQQGVARLTVWDTGIGIAPEDIEQLFQPFVQLDRRLSRQYMGTGLGLVLVARIATLHGGSVAAESTFGQGSRFTITLPWQGSYMDDSDEPDVPKTHNLHVYHGDIGEDVLLDAGRQARQPRKLLIADDNADNIALFSIYLRTRGYAVVGVLNGTDVLERARELQPDLILMDIQMPGIDGLEATRRIRADPALASIPIIGLTASAMPEDRHRCLAAGMSAYLSKPIILQQLVAEIQTLLEGSRVSTLDMP